MIGATTGPVEAVNAQIASERVSGDGTDVRWKALGRRSASVRGGGMRPAHIGCHGPAPILPGVPLTGELSGNQVRHGGLYPPWNCRS